MRAVSLTCWIWSGLLGAMIHYREIGTVARRAGRKWQDYLRNAGPNLELEQCTHAGRPFGDAEFVAEIADRFDRKWIRGRPKRRPDPVSMPSDAQGGFFTD